MVSSDLPMRYVDMPGRLLTNRADFAGMDRMVESGVFLSWESSNLVHHDHDVNRRGVSCVSAIPIDIVLSNPYRRESAFRELTFLKFGES